ncbi:CxC2 domain-containing protein [Mycena sanguinolenta]|uniref:CxC2 domain-containing protein n=1 Tax=Mycena sanguinolenta TaxID=230812 RepID=A0A8H6YMM5_9AGAR|nr:CxC2 domain-containing protein [Mycena sanguinolenta]
MHIHDPHVTSLVSVSANGRHTTETTRIVSSVLSGVPAYIQEDVNTSAVVESWDFSYDLGDTSLLGEVQETAAMGVVLKSKRKVYENSDYPMLTWAQHQDEYLDEMLRLEGRGYAAIYSTCGGCGEANPVFRCEHQTCYGPSLYCQKCVVERHTCLPTHWIEEWNGQFFECHELKSLGLVIQLGHPVGYGYPNPVKAHKNSVVIDVTGVHNVEVNFCHCDGKLEKRQQLMRVCWWPATTRDPQMCATFTVDRHCAFRHIVRQYRTTVMMKRAGRGHDPTGGNQSPEGWDKIDWKSMPEDLCYKYFLFLAQDCNFRLVNRDVSSSGKDPILGDGYGYFVNNEKYAEFLRGHVSEEEISSCSGFRALFLANRKHVKGLCTTGVGGVTCARHNMWRPNGIGDLQLGERFCNMDFILFSALLSIIIVYLILSYDIACQYYKNFWTRMSQLPSSMHLLLDPKNVWFKVPNFHLPPHKVACHSAFLFHYMWGAGRTHGKTVEQNWEFSNGAVASTKVMGVGTQHATLEDLFGFHNWRQTVSWRRIFPKRMVENVTEGQIHRNAFEAFDAALRQTEPAMAESWKKWVETWDSRQHFNGTESPFELKEKGMTMREIRLKLAKEELLRSGEEEEVEQEETPSTFILMGLQIEESQRYLVVDVKAVANPTDAQTVDFMKRRGVLLKRIRAFRKMQRTYMPNLRRYLTPTQRAMLDSETDREAEGVRLFMPSDIVEVSKREKACAVGLPEVEAELRMGEAREALHSLRQALRARTMTNQFCLRHCTGQRMLMRGQGVLHQINLNRIWASG